MKYVFCLFLSLTSFCLYAQTNQNNNTTIKPSLVPLEVYEKEECKKLQGLSLRNVGIKILDTEKNKAIYEDFGEMLFTHFGVSGPLILSASCQYVQKAWKEKAQLTIDLKPALSFEQLEKRVLSDFGERLNCDFINSLDALLPKRLISVIVANSGIDPRKKINSITREERRALIDVIRGLRLTLIGFRPIDEAIITKGGVSVKEIDPKTMESKKCSGLYFAGEVMDLDAYTGGFNLQIAFASAHAAAEAAVWQ